jgi:hypothetical protein
MMQQPDDKTLWRIHFQRKPVRAAAQDMVIEGINPTDLARIETGLYAPDQFKGLNLVELITRPRSSETPVPNPLAPASQQRPELFTLKPGIWGMSIDLKELGRRAVRWWRQHP